MENQHRALEILLLSSLVVKQYRFRPAKVRPALIAIGHFKWAPGDIAVRRSARWKGEFEFAVLPKSEIAVLRGTFIDSPVRYTKITIERIGSDQTAHNASAAGAVSLVGTSWTYQTNFATDQSLQVVIDEDLPCQMEVWYQNVAKTLTMGQKYQILNNNKMQIVLPSGETTFRVLSNHINIETRSFSPRDIIWNMAMLNMEDKPILFMGVHMPQFSLSRPLTHMWTNEAYDLRVVAEEVDEHSGSMAAYDQNKVDRALRYLISGMLDTRNAIRDLILNIFAEVAVELGSEHPTLDKMQSMCLDIGVLEKMLNCSPLCPSLLRQLVGMDLKRTLPIFEAEIVQLFTELGNEFQMRFRGKFDASVPTMGKIGKGSQTWNHTAQYVLLKAHQFSKLQSYGNSVDVLRISLTQANTFPEVKGFEAVLFQGMRSQLTSIRDYESSPLADIRAILSKTRGYVLKRQHLLCWETLELQNKTIFYAVDLSEVQKSLLANTSLPSHEASKKWLQCLEIPMIKPEDRWIDVDKNSVFMVVFEPFDQSYSLHVLRLTPEITHCETMLPSTFAASLCMHVPDYPSRNPHHFCLSCPNHLGMIFLATIYHGLHHVSGIYERRSIDLTLLALTSTSQNTLSQFALTGFEYPDQLEEFTKSWEYDPCLQFTPGMTHNTFGMPYSPLRWCTTRKNVYCLWLLSPHSYKIFGLQKHSFVQVSEKLLHRSLCINRPYVLPTFAIDRVSGMIGLFKARRTWDTQAKCWMVTVYKLRLEHS